MASGLKINGSLSALNEMVSSAGAFTASDSGAAAHHRYILFEAKDGVLSVTAESNLGAICFEPEGVKVHEDGRMLVRHNMLATALGTFEPTQSPTLEHDTKSNKLMLTDGTTENSVVTNPIGEKSLLPSVYQAPVGSGIEVAPEKFIDWYGSLSPFRNQGSIPTVAGVYAYIKDEESFLRGLSTDGTTAFSMKTLEIRRIGDGLEPILLEHEGVSRALQFIKRGSLVAFHLDSETRRLHCLVSSKNKQMYHIWTPLLNTDVSKYPAVGITRAIGEFAKTAVVNVEMKKGDMLQLMRNAASVGALSPTTSGGAAKNVDINLSEGRFEAESGKGTDASYQDDRPADVMPLDTDLGTRFSFGTFGHLIEVYHNEEDPEIIRFALVCKGDRVQAAMFHMNPTLFNEDGQLDDSIMLVPMIGNTTISRD